MNEEKKELTPDDKNVLSAQNENSSETDGGGESSADKEHITSVDGNDDESPSPALNKAETNADIISEDISEQEQLPYEIEKLSSPLIDDLPQRDDDEEPSFAIPKGGRKLKVNIIDAGRGGDIKDSSEKLDRTLRKSGFLNTVKRFIIGHRLYITAFFLPVIILFAAYAAFGVYPFGDMSVLVLDMNGQYVYYFENLRDILHGNGSPFISWSRNLSGEIMGIYAYYLASPFTIIPMILPRSMITESLLIMQLCKVGTAAVTFLFYLKHSRKCSNSTCLIFSMLYGLMGYMVVQLMNPMWLDGLIYLPLIIYGIEKIIDENKWLNFIIPLSLMYMAHFYIGWMVTFFSIIYFLFYYFAGQKNYKLSFKSFFFAGAKFAAGGVIAAAAASWVLLPLYYSLKLGKFEFSTPSYELKTQFDFIDFFKNLLPNVYDTCRPEGSPVVYCGVLTVILMPLFFLNSKIRFRHKVGYGAVLMSVLLSMYLSTVDLAWHGFQVPNWLPYRYSFTFSFVMLVMAATAFERLEGVTIKEIMGSCFALIIYAFYVGRQGFDGVDLALSVWYSVGFTLVYGILLRFVKTGMKGARQTLTLVMGIFVTGELFSSSLATMHAINSDVTYSTHSSYNRCITLGRDTVEKIYEADSFEQSGFYRIEKNFQRTVNDAMAMGYFGISHSSSTLNAAPIQFLRRLGFSYGGHYIKYKGATYVTDAILGIKYVMEKATAESDEAVNDNELPDIEIPESQSYSKLLLTNSDEKECIAVYENPYALPVAFMADSSILNVTLGLDDPFENQNKLLSAMTGSEYKEYFKEISIKSIIPENAQKSTYGNHTKYVPIESGLNSHIEFLLDAPTSDMIYFYMPSSYERKVNLWLNKEFVDYYFEGGNMAVKTLGRFDPGEELSFIVTITEEKGEVLYKDVMFRYLDEEMFSDAVSQIREQGLNVTSWSEDHIEGNIDVKKDGVMFTTISWEPGWTIKVDGEKVEPVEVCDALIGVQLSAGHHEIEMSFFPEGLSLGIICTISGIIAIIVIGISEKTPAGKKEEKQTA